jgi:hypothetical protein
MLYWEIIAVCFQIRTKHISTLCGQNVQLLSVKPGGTYSNHWASEGYTGPKFFGTPGYVHLDQRIITGVRTSGCALPLVVSVRNTESACGEPGTVLFLNP